MTRDLAPLLGLHWPALSHRFAQAFLEHTGWPTCGQGDWAGDFVDLGERHVPASSHGASTVIDTLRLSSRLHRRPADFAREIPASERRYVLDMPDLQAADHPASYLSAIRAALGRCR